MPPTDFWGIVFPNYLAAAGAVLGTAVAVIALIVSLVGRTKTAEVKSEAELTKQVLSDTLTAVSDESSNWEKVNDAVERGVSSAYAGRFGGDAEVWRRLLYRLNTPDAE